MVVCKPTTVPARHGVEIGSKIYTIFFGSSSPIRWCRVKDGQVERGGVVSHKIIAHPRLLQCGLHTDKAHWLMRSVQFFYGMIFTWILVENNLLNPLVSSFLLYNEK